MRHKYFYFAIPENFWPVLNRQETQFSLKWAYWKHVTRISSFIFCCKNISLSVFQKEFAPRKSLQTFIYLTDLEIIRNECPKNVSSLHYFSLSVSKHLSHQANAEYLQDWRFISPIGKKNFKLMCCNINLKILPYLYRIKYQLSYKI